jgi:transcription elongation factor Elf1
MTVSAFTNPMSGTGHAPKKKVSAVAMQIECPRCREKMIVEVGLNPDTRNNSIECVYCRKNFVALVPGPIVKGPF